MPGLRRYRMAMIWLSIMWELDFSLSAVQPHHLVPCPASSQSQSQSQSHILYSVLAGTIQPSASLEHPLAMSTCPRPAPGPARKLLFHPSSRETGLHSPVCLSIVFLLTDK
ncbi:hypothetical protein CLAIMM_00206, partial [Cladophialophora immunda]